MSDAMFAAIRARKGKPSVMGDHEGDHSQDHKGVTDSDNRPVTDFVAKLNDGQKDHLRKILGVQDKEGMDQSQNISKGFASTEEQGKINQKMSQETGPSETENESTGGDQVDSDAIAKSMLDSRYKNGPPDSKPRNLNDRMKQHVAGKLKEKGKL